jgi:polyisoprenoid-binding protein YceI
MEKTKWVIDDGHSQIGFKVKHLAIANVVGTFKKIKGDIACENDDFDNSAVNFEIDVNSIDTNNHDRDGHLRSNLFFNAESFPRIVFVGLLKKEDDDYKLKGNLTILQTTRSVTINVTYTGSGKGRFNDTRAGFEVSGKINRKDFGLNFHVLNDAGNLVVGDEIRLFGDIELIKQ